MKKILIWDAEIAIRNSGGPSGYLYNIKKYLSECQSVKNISFVSEIITQRPPQQTAATEGNKILKFLKRYNPFGLYVLFKIFYEFRVWNSTIDSIYFQDINLNEYEIIHFHSSLDLLRAKNVIKNFNGKIVLTSHSPQPLSYERLDTITNSKLLKEIAGNLLDKYEVRAWNLCNKILFPVAESIDVYRASSRINKYISHSHSSKFIFCPTAILGEEYVTSTKKNIRAELKIPPTAIILCYIGRHNQIKGYDELKNFGKWILENYKNTYIVVAGTQEPLEGLNHPRWIELGWIDYGNDLICQSNLFILPNRETYFDLIALEVLRTGTPILLTRTGGNRYFEKYEQNKRKGMFFYDYADFRSMKESYKNAISMIEDCDSELRNLNLKLFKDNFTIDKFVTRYNSIIDEI